MNPIVKFLPLSFLVHMSTLTLNSNDQMQFLWIPQTERGSPKINLHV